MAETISVQQSRELDQKTINEVGIPSLVLMERAALKIYGDLLANDELDLTKVLVLVGSGNNGGDALDVARLLETHGFDTSVLLIGKPQSRSEQMERQLQICDYYQVKHVFLDEDFGQYTTIVDGLFGSGLARAVEGDFATAIDKANQSGVKIHAIDIPSGLNGDSGEVMGTAVKATSTSTLAYAKTGMVLSQAKPYTGKIFVDDIGIYLHDHYEE
ncbi:carbohydrate kinase [Ligilactobacillus salitolerans]|uniref:NAD(P)H-hydrate epimerase n=1 Tax=Ligilactobacillus salitolerans TaxID=1808352 RepID=A0A401IQE2_9LACO|nr:NAD(P)H-hydrate epimerase [Ligilactobacillus salitolerans]GBG93733.1 carbohydrate kinase [Ligilactobacillus salitolerans]